MTGQSATGTSATGLREALIDKAGKLIELLDVVAERCKDVPLEFPQIIVVGEEASGKSSVLERIAMLQFFPRDRTTAICTRMPMKLQLKHLSVPQMQEFCQKNNQVYFNGCALIRFCYEDKVTSAQQWSQFFNISEVETQIKQYMEGIYIYIFLSLT